MRISVVSPSFNQARFLPDNLRSVAAQTGVAVEHIIVDPGSTDGSIELARAASHAILIAEPDRGQSHGITKGFARATGDVLTWLNSDDFYPAPDVLARVAAAFARHPEADVVYGGVNFVDEAGGFLRKGFVNADAAGLLRSFQFQVGIVQPGVFMRRRVFETVGGPSEDYDYCMDYEYWVRIAAAGFRWVHLDATLAHHRWWPGMKTSSGRGDSLIEHFRVGLDHFGYIHHRWLDRYGEFVATRSDGVVNHAAVVDADAKAAAVRRAIERFVTQDMMVRLSRAQARIAAGRGTTTNGAEDTEMAATADYIARVHPGFRRVLFEPADLPGAVSTHPDPQAPARVAWHIFDTAAPDGRRFRTYTVPDNFTRHFEAAWYHDERERGLERLGRMQRRRRESCVIVANGPSLNRANLDLLRHADVIISNFAVISKPLRALATCLTVVNDLVARQGSVTFNRLDIPKVVPFWLANAINAGEDTVFLPATVAPVFCGALDGTFSWRSTVSFLNMQLAFALGYENVVLIGFDHAYQQAPDVREGTAIVQKGEDPNHFDPRYFQGKTWQAADTNGMEAMYRLARDAYRAAGRRIVNATEGGRLEVFPREALDRALGLAPAGRRPAATAAAGPAGAAAAGPAGAAAAGLAAHPRTLVFDMTALGNGSATGEIKANLLAGWPADRLLQVAVPGKDRLALVRPAGDGTFASRAVPEAAVEAAIRDFAPDLVLYRPVADHPHLHAFAMRWLAAHPAVPLATWIMDDWPARLEADDPARFPAMDADLRSLFSRSALRLSIGTAMSQAFAARYGVPFEAFANGVDPADWPPRHPPAAGPLLVRYAGGLAPDMTASAVLRVARAVETLAGEGLPIAFEINTQPWWRGQVADAYRGFAATRLEAQPLAPTAYRQWLRAADVLLIAYNADAATQRYVRYSMANKMPECLASGAALLAHGPAGIATIDYLQAEGVAAVVTEDSEAAVAAALRRLQAEPAQRAALGERGRALAFAQHNLADLRTRLRDRLAAAARTASGGPAPAPAPPAGDARNATSPRRQLLAAASALLTGEGAAFLPGGPGEAAAAAALAALPEADPAAVQFRRVLAFAAARAGAAPGPAPATATEEGPSARETA